MPAAAEDEAPQRKKRRVLAHEKLYLANLPDAAMYEQSYMHREPLRHVVVTKTAFIISASADGVLMFWKKRADEGIEFVKQFRAHLGAAAAAEGAGAGAGGEGEASRP